MKKKVTGSYKYTQVAVSEDTANSLDEISLILSTATRKETLSTIVALAETILREPGFLRVAIRCGVPMVEKLPEKITPPVSQSTA